MLVGYGEFRLNAEESAQRLEARAKTEAILSKADQKLAVRQIKKSSKRWKEKVEEGQKIIETG